MVRFLVRTFRLIVFIVASVIVIPLGFALGAGVVWMYITHANGLRSLL